MPPISKQSFASSQSTRKKLRHVLMSNGYYGPQPPLQRIGSEIFLLDGRNLIRPHIQPTHIFTMSVLNEGYTRWVPLVEQELLTFPRHAPGFYQSFLCSVLRFLCTVLQINLFVFLSFFRWSSYCMIFDLRIWLSLQTLLIPETRNSHYFRYLRFP